MVYYYAVSLWQWNTPVYQEGEEEPVKHLSINIFNILISQKKNHRNKLLNSIYLQQFLLNKHSSKLNKKKIFDNHISSCNTMIGQRYFYH